MAITQLRGSRQVLDGSINVAKLATESNVTWVMSSDNTAKITGLAAPTSATDVVTKEYVDGMVDSNLKSPDSFATNAAGDYPTDYKGSGTVSEGDMFYVTDVTNGTTVGTSTVNVGDALVALADNPGNTDSNWLIMESNRDQATESIRGVARIATQSETNAATDDSTIVTPLKLDGRLQDLGITKVIAGAGLTETTSGTDKTLDVVSANGAITVNADDIQFNIGTDNGTSLEISSTGVELATSVTGSREFAPGTGNTFKITADQDLATLGTSPSGTVDAAIADVGYVNNLVSSATREIYGEAPTVTDGSTDVTLANTPTTGTLRVYLNGLRMLEGSGNDYTVSGATVTFASALAADDIVQVDYKY